MEMSAHEYGKGYAGAPMIFLSLWAMSFLNVEQSTFPIQALAEHLMTRRTLIRLSFVRVQVGGC
jgi:hypothetical protein